MIKPNTSGDPQPFDVHHGLLSGRIIRVTLSVTATLTLALASNAWAVFASSANDICAANVDPCVISQQFDIIDGSVLDFGTRTVRIATGGQLDTNTGTATVLAGTFLVDAGLTSPLKVRGSVQGVTSGGTLILSARRRCNAGPQINVACLKDDECTNGTCSVGGGTINIASPIRANGGTEADARSGSVNIKAAGDITLGALVTASSGASQVDGGFIAIESANGNVVINGSLTATGGGQAAGGAVSITSARDITISQIVDVNGGAFDGGIAELIAGRDAFVKQSVRASSTSAGGAGGQIFIGAGRDLLVSPSVGIEAKGSGSAFGYGGDGGVIQLSADGNVTIPSSSSLVADSAPPDGFAGQLSVQAGQDAMLGGTLSARTAGSAIVYGVGGVADIRADGMLTLPTGSVIDVRGGQSGGGAVFINTKGATLDGLIDTRTSSDGYGGNVTISINGTGTAGGQILLAGTSDGTRNGRLTLEFCELTLKAGAAFENVGANGSNTLKVRKTLTSEPTSRLAADAASGSNRIYYRSLPPVLAGTIVPAPTMILAPQLAPCAVCGDAVADVGEECDDGNQSLGDGCRPDCTLERCGDGILDPSETCDGNAGACPGQCGPSCTCARECMTDEDCDDDNACTSDTCAVDGTCARAANTGAECSDGIYCNGDDTCSSAGRCDVHPGRNCDDGVTCTADTCNEVSRSCDHVTDDAVCDDGRFCNGAETCDADRGCLAGAAPDCSDTIPCTTDACDEPTRSCNHVTDDTACDDGRFCNGTETCDADRGCLAGAAPDCSDTIPCTTDTCDEPTRSCNHVTDDAACDDGRFCNGTERCDADRGCLAGVAPDCSDTIPCTTDTCDEPTRSCNHVTDDAACDDGFLCNGLETCDMTAGCQDNPIPPCGDENACTSDTCNATANSCEYEDISASCDDGDTCTLDSCDPALGCLNEFDPTDESLCSPSIGRMTGGGRFYLDADYRSGVTHSFNLDCDPFGLYNRLRVTWRKDRHRMRFVLRQLQSATCSDNPMVGPFPPDAGFDSHQGSGRGTLRHGRDVYVAGATATWRFTDAGEPNTADDITGLIITDPDGNIVLMANRALFSGNHQAHPR